MSPPPKKSITKRTGSLPGSTTGKSLSATALTVGAAKAVELLSDPRTREQLLQLGASLSDNVRAKAAARKLARASSQDDPGGIRDRLSRQHRLQSRADHLGATVNMLNQTKGTQSSEALLRISEVIEQIHVSISVSENLPVRRRIIAQNEIAAVLTKLERAVLDATMPASNEF